MGRKKGNTALSLALLGAGAVAFFGLGGTGYVKSAFGSRGETSPKTGTDPPPKTEPNQQQTQPEPIPQDGNNTTFVFYPNETPFNKFDSRQEEIIRNEDRNRAIQERIIRENLQKRKSEPARINVNKPEFVTEQEKENPVKFNKRKFGTDDKLLESALSKDESQRSIDEKKQIENEKAKLIFDSSKISNF